MVLAQQLFIILTLLMVGHRLGSTELDAIGKFNVRFLVF